MPTNQGRTGDGDLVGLMKKQLQYSTAPHFMEVTVTVILMGRVVRLLVTEKGQFYLIFYCVFSV